MIGVMKSSTNWINTPTAFLMPCLQMPSLVHAASSKRASDTRGDRKDSTMNTHRATAGDSDQVTLAAAEILSPSREDLSSYTIIQSIM